MDYEKKIREYMVSSKVDQLYKSMLINLFPELAESEDERIRKELINFCKIAATGQSSILIEDANQFNRWTAWLEKQGEQKDIIYPKYRIKDWIQCNNYEPIQIINIKNNAYVWSNGDIRPIEIVDNNDNIHLVEQKPVGLNNSVLQLWHDATEKCADNNAQILFHSTYDNSWNLSSSRIANWNVIDKWALLSDIKNIKNIKQKPTDKIEPKFKVGQTIKKEGFNLGFTIVKIEDCFYYNDMGDYFPFTDQDNWELVEQKPVEWSEEDLSMIGRIRSIIEKYAFSQSAVDVNGELCEKEFIDADNWLKSLKDRVQPQPKQGWNKEDEQEIEEIIDILTARPFIGTFFLQKHITWLKSLRPQKKQEHIEPSWLDEANNDEELLIAIEALEKAGQHDSALWVKHLADSYHQSHWKPSEEQMEALTFACIKNAGIDKSSIKALYDLKEQLKQL